VSSQAVREAGLTLIGVGPGDPALMTLAAVQAIELADVVAYPVAKLGGDSIAAKIASRWINPQQLRLPMLFPMVKEAEPRLEAWRQAGDQLAGAVAEGQRVVFLCEGDVSLYASGSYVLRYLQAHHSTCPLRLIPGITAMAAAAAAGAWPLALQQDQLLVLPTPDQPQNLEKLLDDAAGLGRVLALLKLGHRWTWVRPLLEQRGLLQDSLFAKQVGWPDQQLMPANEVSAETSPYFSLLLVRQSWPEVMP